MEQRDSGGLEFVTPDSRGLKESDVRFKQRAIKTDGEFCEIALTTAKIEFSDQQQNGPGVAQTFRITEGARKRVARGMS